MKPYNHCNSSISERGIVALVVGMAALLWAAATVPTASAQTTHRWGAVVIRNPYEVAIPFQMRVGTEGPWKDYTVAVRTEYVFHFPLDQNGRSLLPHIRFQNGKGAIKTYSLPFYEVNIAATHLGKPYKFEYNAQTGWDLYTAEEVRDQPGTAVPPVAPPGPLVWVESVTVTTKVVPNEIYDVAVTVRSRHHRSVGVLIDLHLPEGDRLASIGPAQVIPPGGSATVYYGVRCGPQVHGTVWASVTITDELP